MRDLYQQAGNYRGRRRVDTTTVALAAVGITLTVATVVSLGATLPGEGRRQHGQDRQPHRPAVAAAAPPGDHGWRAKRSTPARCRTLGKSLGAFDLAAVRAAARRIVRPAPAAKLKQLGADVATLGENAGYRGTLDALAKADDATAISRMARLSKTFGKATRGALFMLGDAALTLASIAVAVFSWTAGALFWIIAAIVIVTRPAVLVLRLGFGALWWAARKLRNRPRLAARVDGVLARA